MIALNHLVRKAGLDALYFSGANRLLRPWAEGVGAVLMLHRVRPGRFEPFQPNKFLEITPEFLERMIKWLMRNSYQFISLDEARSRLVDRRFDARVVAMTFDDGFRDNKAWAQPILAKYGVPYTIFVPTDFAEGVGNLWWLVLESIIANNDQLDVDGCAIDCRSTQEKYRAYATLQRLVLSQPSQPEEHAFVRRLAARYRCDEGASARAACMGWDEIRELAADPLATIGAHTISHPILAKAPESVVREELIQGRRILEQKLQRDVRHFAYPYGSADAVGAREFAIASEAGYQTAVTTRTGVLVAEEGACLMALPRIAIDGKFQRERHLDVLLSGVAPAVWNRLRHARSGAPGRAAWA